jgi:SAM-dependent methyltransferase
MIAKYSVEELVESADQYYRRFRDPTPLMSKPWASLQEAPDMLRSLGTLLSGLELGRSMSVLEFGAGTCWLSRCLAQLNCRPICCDASATALEIGRRLFKEFPPIGAAFEPTFLLFDGHRIELPDASVDRIICFDSFHHVPNPREILEEFARVLRPGGIAGFSEPGREHSQAPQSQYEMRSFVVLENDIRLDEIFEAARPAGFTELNVSTVGDSLVSLQGYMRFLFSSEADDIDAAVLAEVRATLRNQSVFFLHKGPLQRDSRSCVGLEHELRCSSSEYEVPRGSPLHLTVALTNRGRAAWLSRKDDVFGIVRIGTHLCAADGRVLEVDHSRHDLPMDLRPGQSMTLDVTVPLPAEGSYRLALDLVAEGVMWFEDGGSKPLYLTVNRPRSG